MHLKLLIDIEGKHIAIREAVIIGLGTNSDFSNYSRYIANLIKKKI